jgi:NADH-quinone oxidoreductase subunit N
MSIDINWIAFAPALTLLVVACIAILFAVFQPEEGKATALIALVGVVFAFILNLNEFLQGWRLGVYHSSFGGRFIADAPALAFNFVILVGVFLAILIAYDYLERTHLDHPEYYPLLLLSACGAMVMASAGDLITLVLGLEIMSLAVYVLSAWRQNARESEEAGMKYFLLGAFASAFLIYGIAMMYGATGHFTYAGIASALQADGFNKFFYASLGGVMLIAGLGFKVAFAPFHQWAPDVYTGAPTSVTAFMGVVVKAGAFAAFLRVVASFFPELPPVVTQVLAVMIFLTLVIGNLGALMQTSLKRMLAYSAVGHAGYLGLALLNAGGTGINAAAWYLMAYTLMTAGAFAVLTLLTDKNDYGDTIERFAGLGKTKPFLAVSLTIFLLSLAGIPLLAGFVGKILVFQAAIQAGYTALAVAAVITSVIALVYYVRPIVYMYFRESEYVPMENKSGATRFAIIFALAGTVLLGVFPGWWYGLLEAGQRLLAGM